MFSMYSDMSKRTRLFSLPNRKPASARATSVFAHAGGAQEQERPSRPVGRFQPARERRMARASAEIAFPG